MTELSAPPFSPARFGSLRIRQEPELSSLAPAWDQLALESETLSPFLGFPWIRTWLETFGALHEPLLLVVEDDLGITAVAPLARTTRTLAGLRYRVLEIVGTGPLRYLGMGLADRADLLLVRRRAESARLILEWLARRRHDWDILDLRFLPADSTTAQVFRSAPELELNVQLEPLSLSPYLRLEGSFEGYLRRRGRNFRKGLKRKRDRLESRGEVTIELNSTTGTADPVAALASARAIAAGSWKAREGSALLLHENVVRFLETLLPRLAARSELYLALLSVAGEPVAHELGFRLGNKLWSYDSVYREDFAAGSPGNLLTARVLEAAFEAGHGEYDFLRGNESYKSAWLTEERREVQLVLDSGTPLARLAARIAFHAKWALKRSPRLVALQGRAAGLLNKRALASRPARRD